MILSLILVNGTPLSGYKTKKTAADAMAHLRMLVCAMYTYTYRQATAAHYYTAGQDLGQNRKNPSASASLRGLIITFIN